MIETALIIGIVAPLFVIQIYNARQIAQLRTKIDFIYNNVHIKMDWANTKHQPGSEEYGMENGRP